MAFYLESMAEVEREMNRLSSLKNRLDSEIENIEKQLLEETNPFEVERLKKINRINKNILKKCSARLKELWKSRKR